jgi:hypothetical protein
MLHLLSWAIVPNDWRNHAAVFAATKRLILSRQKLWSEYSGVSDSAVTSPYQMNERRGYACKLKPPNSLKDVMCFSQAPPVMGSMIDLTSDTTLAGKPPC